MKCDRCKRETNIFTMSKFNDEHICPDCEEREKRHPKYDEARRADEEAVQRGDLNFPGIAAPSELYENEEDGTDKLRKAAPDLLAALRRFINPTGHTDACLELKRFGAKDCTKVCAEARAAIEKATGEAVKSKL